MKEAVSKFWSMVEAEQQNGGPNKTPPLNENWNPAISSNQEQGMDQATKIQKGVDRHPTDVDVKSR